MEKDKQKHLFILDVDRIQDYIFSTNRLKTIIGASRLLDNLNADENGMTFKLLGECGFESKAGAPYADIRKSNDFILSAGGNTKVIFPSKPLAERFDKEICREYEKFGIGVTTWIHPVATGAGFIQNTLRPAEAMLMKKKYCRPKSLEMAGAPYLKICELCGKAYAEDSRKEKKEGEVQEIVLCRVCACKYDNAKEDIRLFPDYKFLTNMDEMSLTKKMAAVVVMDGNNMGNKINKLQSREDLKKFSCKAERIIKESFDKSLGIFEDEKKSCVFKSIRPLIMGGDDICFIIDAPYALKFIHQLTSEIENRSRKGCEVLFNGGITMSTGALFIKKNFPFNFAHRIAESLLRSAKAESRKKGNCSMVDFHSLLSSSGDEIEKTREREYHYGGNLVLTSKPYKNDCVENFLKDVRTLNEALARNKIKYLRQALRWGRDESTLEILKILARLEGSKRTGFRKIINDYGWKTKSDGFWHTGLLDLVELTDLIGGDHGTD